MNPVQPRSNSEHKKHENSFREQSSKRIKTDPLTSTRTFDDANDDVSGHNELLACVVPSQGQCFEHYCSVCVHLVPCNVVVFVCPP